jgi:uncharacterized protein
MLLVPTVIQRSSIQGIGLFSVTNIPKGTVVWRWNAVLDHEIPWDVAKAWPEITQEFLHTYAYRNLEQHTWVLCGDAMRHCNHSFTPNLQSGGPYGEDRAIRDIYDGEELTIDYREFDPDFQSDSAHYH